MFRKLGQFVVRYWKLLIVAWIAFLAAVTLCAPRWQDVTLDGEFGFLPTDMPSREAEELFAKTFPKDILASTVAIVVHRRREDIIPLTADDREFIRNVLTPAIGTLLGDALLDTEIDDLYPAPDEGVELSREAREVVERIRKSVEVEPVVRKIRNYRTPVMGRLLDSPDDYASLVMIAFETDFTAVKNGPVIERIEELLETLKRPAGLRVAITGTATAGRDMRVAADESGRATENLTVILVVVLLILIYRAPVLALIPLATVAVATRGALNSLALLSQLPPVEPVPGLEVGIKLFAGIEVYITVIVYGAGVDYCLFLIARYKEELDAGATVEEAIEAALAKVGAALTASAGTVMCGIGMMVFAAFGKFQHAGVAITFGLAVCLAAALTFTPSLLRLTGRWAFWPDVPTERLSGGAGWISPTSLVSRLQGSRWLQEGWVRVSEAVLRRPATILVASVACMLPFAVVGVIYYNYLSYGLLSELPITKPSRQGTEALQRHFAAGTVSPVTVLIRNQGFDFTESGGANRVKDLTKGLESRLQELQLSDVRSWAAPLGLDANREMNLVERRSAIRVAESQYVSQVDPHITRLDLVFEDDPFSRNSISQFRNLRMQFREFLPAELEQETELFFLGATPSIFDLKTVTDQDQIKIDILVLSGVFVILVVLLRRVAISGYLILTVFFSYLATLGVTIAFFWALDPAGFSGLDWKVPMFLFTILIAVGEDYNIFLMTRIDEEQVQYGRVRGVCEALQRTGSIISSCGIIMAGTFSSLLAGSLVGMVQLGFALAFGVLLDTFVVRPILVPAYLIMLHSGRFGRLGPLLGEAGPR